MRRIAVVTSKGGTAKTTTALCLAVGLAGRGLRVLLADADSQSNASMTMLEGKPAEAPTLGHVLLGEATAEEAIRPTRVGGLEILPADPRLADAALSLADAMGREYRFRRAVDGLEGRYDVIIADCPPGLSLVVVNVLAGVNELVVPLDSGVYAVSGLAQLQETIEAVREYLSNRSLRILGLLLTRAHSNRASRDLAEQLRAAYGPLVFASVIPHSVRVEESHARNRTVLEFAPTSAPALAYLSLVSEVLGDGNGQQEGNPGTIAVADQTDEPEPADDGSRARPGRGRRTRRAS